MGEQYVTRPQWRSNLTHSRAWNKHTCPVASSRHPAQQPPPLFVLSRPWPQQSSVYRETIDNRDSDRHLEIFFKQTMWLLAPDAEDSPGLSPNGSGVKG